jgi:uncharacterized protein
MKTRALIVLISIVLPAMADREAAIHAYERRDFATALKEWQSLADKGDPEAEFRLGAMYEKGEGVKADPSQAAKWYRKSADQGYAKAQYALGKTYADGRGVLQDYIEAHKWLNLASSNGEPEAAKQRDDVANKMTPAQVAEAQRLAKEWKPVPTQPSLAGNTGGSLEVLRVGNGVSAPAVLYKVDPDYSEEARKAHVSGTVVLQLIVEPTGNASDIRVLRGLGNGLDEKAVEAVSKWKFRPGVKDGQPVAVMATIEVNFRLFAPPPTQSAQQPPPAPASTAPSEQTSKPAPTAKLPSPALGDIGKGFEAYKHGDYATALAEYSRSAEDGNPYALNNLGSLYYHGQGVTQDYAKAVELYTQASERGAIPVVYNNLGHCYQKGQGVQRDYVQALVWFTLAGPPSDDIDREARADALAHLTPAERGKAQESAVEWLCSRGRPFITQPDDGALIWTGYSLIHPVSTSTGIIPEKGIRYKGVAVYANVTRDKGTLWSNVTVWNIDDKDEIGVDPNYFKVMAGSANKVTSSATKTTVVYAVPPTKAMGAGRTSATIQALILSLGSNRRTASVNGVDTTSGDIYSGTVTYTDPELERQRAEAVQRTLDQQAAAEQHVASILLWPTVLRTSYCIRGGVEFRKIPKDDTHILLIVTVNGVLYNLPFVFQGKDYAGR